MRSPDALASGERLTHVLTFASHRVAPGAQNPSIYVSLRLVAQATTVAVWPPTPRNQALLGTNAFAPTAIPVLAPAVAGMAASTANNITFQCEHEPRPGVPWRPPCCQLPAGQRGR